MSGPAPLEEANRGSDISAQQLTASDRGGGVLHRILLPQACVDLVHFEPALAFEGAMAPDCRTMVFVLKCPRPGHSMNFGTTHGPGYMGFFRPGGPLDAFTPAGYENISLTMPETRFQEMLHLHGGGIPDKTLSQGAAIRVDARCSARIMHAARGICDMLRDPGARLREDLALEDLERDHFL